jgi:hypothetical protein
VASRQSLPGRECDEALFGGPLLNPGGPRNIAASIREKLLNIATRNREDFGLILTRYALERLLYRLSQSSYRDHFVLKGAMLFQVWADVPHRPCPAGKCHRFGLISPSALSKSDPVMLG